MVEEVVLKDLMKFREETVEALRLACISEAMERGTNPYPLGFPRSFRRLHYLSSLPSSDGKALLPAESRPPQLRLQPRICLSILLFFFLQRQPLPRTLPSAQRDYRTEEGTAALVVVVVVDDARAYAF